MKIFVGQAVTGEDIQKIREESKKICEVLGNESYCTLIEPEDFEEKGNKEKMYHAFEKIDESDALLAIVRNERKSEGLLIEIGYCLGKNKKIILAINRNVKNSYLDEIADKVIEFDNFDDLIKKIGEIK